MICEREARERERKVVFFLHSQYLPRPKYVISCAAFAFLNMATLTIAPALQSRLSAGAQTNNLNPNLEVKVPSLS